jgi:hypothetical protein
MSPGEDPPDGRNKKITGKPDRNFQPARSLAGGAAVDAAIREALGRAQQMSAELERCRDRLNRAADDLAATGQGSDRARAIIARFRSAAEAVKHAQARITPGPPAPGARAQQRPPTRGGAAGR